MSEHLGHGVHPDEPARFLHGWGGVVAALLGLPLAALAGQATVWFWSLVDRFLMTNGASVQVRVASFHWLGVAAWTVYLALVLFRSPQVDPFDGLRRGVGDWTVIRRIALGCAPFGALVWTAMNAPVGLSAQYDAYAHGAAGVWAYVLIAVVLTLTWFLRSRRARGHANLEKAVAGPS